ncbi:MAG: GDP-mannose 4,6-dehydratase [Anaerolineae bacterium]
MKSSKNILITGIAGFIGFHLALALKKRGDLVRGCDNFNAYYDPALKRTRASKLAQNDIEIFEADIRETPFIQKLLIDHDISHVVHLAAQAGVRHSIKHPESYVQNNLDGFVQILEACRRHPNLAFTYASSSSVYGLNTKIPFAESDPTDKPASLYGATKKANEVIAHAYHHLYGLPVTGLRFFTAYGPWGRPDMAYFSFTKAILNEEPIQIYNQGQMRRDFTYIDDIVEGIIAAIDYRADCEIFNLGNQSPVDVLELIALIEKYTGKTAIKQFLPMQQGEVPMTYADISKSQEKLGFKPRTKLDDGMKRFIEWYLTYFNRALR